MAGAGVVCILAALLWFASAAALIGVKPPSRTTIQPTIVELPPMQHPSVFETAAHHPEEEIVYPSPVAKAITEIPIVTAVPMKENSEHK